MSHTRPSRWLPVLLLPLCVAGADAANLSTREITLATGQSMAHVIAILCATLGGVVWGAWGPQYIFYMAAALSLLNYYVAWKVKLPEKSVAASLR